MPTSNPTRSRSIRSRPPPQRMTAPSAPGITRRSGASRSARGSTSGSLRSPASLPTSWRGRRDSAAALDSPSGTGMDSTPMEGSPRGTSPGKFPSSDRDSLRFRVSPNTRLAPGAATDATSAASPTTSPDRGKVRGGDRTTSRSVTSPAPSVNSQSGRRRGGRPRPAMLTRCSILGSDLTAPRASPSSVISRCRRPSTGMAARLVWALPFAPWTEWNSPDAGGKTIDSSSRRG